MHLKTLIEFGRPHTLIGTILANLIFYLVINSVYSADHQWLLLLITTSSSLLVNFYIVGLNQITDIEIDKINKPFLPMANGKLAKATANLIVGFCGLGCLAVAALAGWPFFTGISLILIIGTLYSLPPIRLKKYPFWAAISIVIARAIILNLALSFTFTKAFSGHFSFPNFIGLFLFIFAGLLVVISIMKDIPDIEGDEQHKISTIALKFGQQKALGICQALLLAIYVIAIGFSALGTEEINPLIMAVCHLAPLIYVSMTIGKVVTDEIPAYYQKIWVLYYYEFLAFFASCIL